MIQLLRLLVLSLSLCAAHLAIPGRVLAQDRVVHLEAAIGRDPLSTTMVEVSTRRVRIAFPRDTSGAWSWPARENRAVSGYVWGVHLVSLEGPVTASFATFHRDTTALSYSSLEQLVAEGSTMFCLPSMRYDKCGQSDLFHASVENDRLVLTLNDSTIIHKIFGIRPHSIAVYRQSGPDSAGYENDSVPVRYVPPYIRVPDSALLAEAARGRRRYEASITTIARSITSGEGWWHIDDLWVALGDSIRLDLEEIHCHHDSCGSFRGQVNDSGWGVKNPRIAALTRTCGSGCAMAHGRRIGKTTITVRGLHGRSDTLPSREPPPRRIERGIRVGRPVARIQVVPIDSVFVGQPRTFSARAFDRMGKVVPNVPIELRVETGLGYNQLMVVTRPGSVEFRKEGRRTVVASFWGLADTLVVTVLGKNNLR